MGKLRLGHRNQYASVHEHRATPSVKLLIAHEFWNLDDTHISSRWTLDVGRSWTFSVRCLAHFGTVLQELRYWLSLSRQVPVELVQLAQREQELLAPDVKWHTAHGYQRNSKTVRLSVESGQEKKTDKAKIMSKKKINMQCNEIDVAT